MGTDPTTPDTREEERYEWEEPVETDALPDDEPLDRKTTLADDAAPAGHLTDTEAGPRQHGDVNPELGRAPDELAGTARPRGAQADEGLTEPDQIDIDRPDVGTPVSDTSPAPVEEE